MPAPRIALNSKGQFHSTDGPAIDWANGRSRYFLSGVSFAKKLWEELCTTRQFSRSLLALGNIEQRRVALQMLGAGTVLTKKGTLLDTENGYELYSLPQDVFGIRSYFLKYTCPSTGREYVSEIDPNIGRLCTVRLALKWKFCLDECDVYGPALFTAES